MAVAFKSGINAVQFSELPTRRDAICPGDQYTNPSVPAARTYSFGSAIPGWEEIAGDERCL